MVAVEPISAGDLLAREDGEVEAELPRATLHFRRRDVATSRHRVVAALEFSAKLRILLKITFGGTEKSMPRPPGREVGGGVR